MTGREDQNRVDAAGIVELAPDGVVVVDGSGAIVLVNCMLEELFGYSRDELVGSPVEILLPERFRKEHQLHRGEFGVHPRVRSLGTGLALFGQRKDGSEFAVDISLSPVPLPGGDQQTIATIRDIGERLALTQQVQESLDAFQTAFEAAPVGMATVSFDDPVHRRLTSVNQALCDMLGYSRKELLTMGFAELTYHEDSDVSDRAAQAVVRGEIHRYGLEKRYVCKDGTTLWAWVHTAVVPRVEGVPRQVLVHIADLSERKRAEEARELALRTEERIRVLEGRERLAEDLHDVIIQKLFATGMSLQAVQSGVTDQALRDRIGDSVHQIDDTIAELRAAIFRLNAPHHPEGSA